MQAKNILLTTINSKYIHTNVAIRLLYSLYKDSHDLEWKEFTLKENTDDIAAHCNKYDIVCFSCYIWNITATLEVAKKIKDENPNCKILLGGPEVSYEWEPLMEKPFIDFIIIGEGEIPFGEFLTKYPELEGIKSLVHRKENNILNTPGETTFPLEQYKNLLLYRFDDPSTLNDRVLYIETSRGCPYKCEFCLASLDNKVRYLPMEVIHQNLLYMMKHGKVIKFLDRTFNMKRDFTLEIFDFILQHYQPGNIFQFEITADILHPDIITYIQEKVPKNLFRFEIGIQTVNQKANLEVQRKQNFEKTKSIIRQVENKVELHLDLIVGLALDYWEDIRYSIEEVFKLEAPELQLGFLKFLKGTPLKDKHEKHGFVFDPNPPYQIIESNYLSREELNKLLLLEHALEIYWNNQRACTVLKYVNKKYSAFDFLLQLGTEFNKRHSLIHYTLENVYTCLYDIVSEYYAEDNYLKNLVVLDYFLHFKVRPKDLFKCDLDLTQKKAFLKKFGLQNDNYRYIVFPIVNSLEEHSSDEAILHDGKSYFVVRYNGVEKSQLIRENILN